MPFCCAKPFDVFQEVLFIGVNYYINYILNIIYYRIGSSEKMKLKVMLISGNEILEARQISN